MIKVAVLVGSIRVDSMNYKLAKNLERLAPKGTEFDYLDIKSLPLFSQDLEVEFPESATVIKHQLDEADAILFISPEYNHSITGVMKNAIDWGSRPWGSNSWGGKPSGIVGVTTSLNGTRFAQAVLASIIEWFKSPLYSDEKLMITADESTFSEDGNVSGELERGVKKYIDGFVAWVKDVPEHTGA
jgi:chromate reductase